MDRKPAVTMLIVAALCMTVVGCGRARRAMEAARTVQDARDGEFTVKGEKGEEVKVETHKQGQDAGKVTVTTKEGQTTAVYGTRAVTEKDVGIAFYPGATVETGSTATTTGKDGGTWAGVNLLTTDSFADVAKFYKDKYAQGNTVVAQPNMLMITISSGQNSGRMIMVMPDTGSGKVRITIAAGGKD